MRCAAKISNQPARRPLGTPPSPIEWQECPNEAVEHNTFCVEHGGNLPLQITATRLIDSPGGPDVEVYTYDWHGTATEWEAKQAADKEQRRRQSQLEQVAAWSREAALATTERDNMIRVLREDGMSLRAIAGVAGLSHTAIAKICAK